MTQNELLTILEKRFNENTKFHPSHKWEEVLKRLDTKSLDSILQMELSGGKPDVVDLNNNSSEIIFVDTAIESPVGRRSLCYDQKALNDRKTNKPLDSAMNMANTMGVEILNEQEYRKLFSFGEFDLKTSSWILTPDNVRSLGGAYFCDYRYKTVFLYHNGADSYYSSRGFRGKLVVVF